MQRILGILLFCLVLVDVSAFGRAKYCFKNDGLKDSHKVSFTIDNNKVEGTFEVSAYLEEDKSSDATRHFSGSRSGNLLTIKFEGKPPYPLPPNSKRIVWTLRNRTLKIPLYGKNYDTGKYSTYIASYEKCKNDE